MNLLIRGYTEAGLKKLGFPSAESLVQEAANAFDDLRLGKVPSDKDRLTLQLFVQWMKENDGEELQQGHEPCQFTLFLRIWRKWGLIPPEHSTISDLAPLIGKKRLDLEQIARDPNRFLGTDDAREARGFCLELIDQINLRDDELMGNVYDPYPHEYGLALA